MGIIRGIWRIMSRWYISAAILAALGVLGGYLFFFNVYPGEPLVAVIDVPFTVLDNDSAWFIGEMLDYAYTTDSITAVVIKLDSPGGFVAPSEELYLKVLKLRGRKPVVVSTGSNAASGGYLVSLAANYIYVKPTSFVGNVGAVFVENRQSTPDERFIYTGPGKLTGSTGRTFTAMTESIKDYFIQAVMSQRGNRLSIGPDELAKGRLYLGTEGVRLGLVDAIGTDLDAIEKAADLAGVSHYDLVDVNEKVLRECIRKVRGLLAPSGEDEPVLQLPDLRCSNRVLAPGESATAAVDVSDLPFEVSLPQMYYLYVTPSE